MAAFASGVEAAVEAAEGIVMRPVILESPYAGNVRLHERYARACMALEVG